MVYDPDEREREKEREERTPICPILHRKPRVHRPLTAEEKIHYFDDVLKIDNDQRGMTDRERAEWETECIAGQHGPFAQQLYRRKVAKEEGREDLLKPKEPVKSNIPTAGDLAAAALQQIIPLKIGPKPEDVPPPTDADAPASPKETPASLPGVRVLPKGPKANLAPALPACDEITGGPVPDDPDEPNLWEGEEVGP